MTEKEIKHLYKQENFIIDNLKIQNEACKGCQQEAIKYHIMLLDVITFIIEQHLWEVIK